MVESHALTSVIAVHVYKATKNIISLESSVSTGLEAFLHLRKLWLALGSRSDTQVLVVVRVFHYWIYHGNDTGCNEVAQGRRMDAWNMLPHGITIYYM